MPPSVSGQSDKLCEGLPNIGGYLLQVFAMPPNVGGQSDKLFEGLPNVGGQFLKVFPMPSDARETSVGFLGCELKEKSIYSVSITIQILINKLWKSQIFQLINGMPLVIF